MPQQGKMLAPRQNAIHRAHVVERSDASELSSDFHTCATAQTCTRMHTELR